MIDIQERRKHPCISLDLANPIKDAYCQGCQGQWLHPCEKHDGGVTRFRNGFRPEQRNCDECGDYDPDSPYIVPTIQALLLNPDEDTIERFSDTDWPEEPIILQDATLSEAIEALDKSKREFCLVLRGAMRFNKYLWHNLYQWPALRGGQITQASLLQPDTSRKGYAYRYDDQYYAIPFESKPYFAILWQRGNFPHTTNDFPVYLPNLVDGQEGHDRRSASFAEGWRLREGVKRYTLQYPEAVPGSLTRDEAEYLYQTLRGRKTLDYSNDPQTAIVVGQTSRGYLWLGEPGTSESIRKALAMMSVVHAPEFRTSEENFNAVVFPQGVEQVVEVIQRIKPEIKPGTQLHFPRYSSGADPRYRLTVDEMAERWNWKKIRQEGWFALFMAE